MWDVDCLNWYDEYMWVNESPMTGDKLPIESTPLMQFTGLLDKNGKEIYEGDLTSCLGNKPKEVIFHKGCFCHKVGEKDYHIFGEKDWEIIGNIYENPELI